LEEAENSFKSLERAYGLSAAATTLGSMSLAKDISSSQLGHSYVSMVMVKSLSSVNREVQVQSPAVAKQKVSAQT
jgi:hypothetical protein